MTDIDLKTISPDTSLPTTGFLFGADSQASTNPSVYSTQTVATTLLGSTSLTGDTLTASAPVLNLTQTWNNGAVTFTGVKLNVTNTASGGASLLADLQVGGVSQFNVNKTGVITTPIIDGAVIRVSDGSPQNFLSVSNYSSWSTTRQVVGVSEVNAASAGGFSINNDTILSRKAAANFRFGAADAASPAAQKLSVQSVVAGPTTNTPGANFTITGSQGIGSGAGGSIIFQVAPAGTAGNPAQNALVDALTINSSKQAAFVSGTSSIPSIIFNGSTTTGIYEPYGNQIGFSMTTALRYLFGGSAFSLGYDIPLRWTNSSFADGTNDTSLSRAAAGIVQVGTTAANASGTLKAAVVGTTTAYTVATLPTGFAGARAYVTDATLPTYLGTLTGGGAVVCPVFYNGTAWVSA